jgi:Fur family ferric uptake transcriptional regulator
MKNSYILEFKNALKKEDLKFTAQRFAIFNFFISTKGHYDCDRIIEHLKTKKIKVSKATVYRTLELLVNNNFIRKMILDDGIARYENKMDSPHHDHMICIDTGKILEFHSAEIEDIQESIAKEKGYVIVKHIHQLFVKKIDAK